MRCHYSCIAQFLVATVARSNRICTCIGFDYCDAHTWWVRSVGIERRAGEMAGLLYAVIAIGAH